MGQAEPGIAVCKDTLWKEMNQEKQKNREIQPTDLSDNIG